MAHGSFVTDIELGKLQRGLAMSLEAICYNMLAALGGRSSRNPWAVKDHVWVLHQLMEIVANHQITAAEGGLLMDGLRLPDDDTEVQ